jgi:hypothetical protein
MANLVTLSGFVLVLAAVLLVYGPPTPWRLVAVPLLILAFATDALDGYVARRLGESSRFGDMLDIAVDRIVEITLWIVLADLDLVPVWVPILYPIHQTQAALSRIGCQTPYARSRLSRSAGRGAPEVAQGLAQERRGRRGRGCRGGA